MHKEGEWLDGFLVTVFVEGCEGEDEFEEAGGSGEEFACCIIFQSASCILQREGRHVELELVSANLSS
jgi:hypothetical protein